MKLENNLLNISMPQSDRVQAPSAAQSQASGRAQNVQSAGDGGISEVRAGAGCNRAGCWLIRSGEHHAAACGRWFNRDSTKWIPLHLLLPDHLGCPVRGLGRSYEPPNKKRRREICQRAENYAS